MTTLDEWTATVVDALGLDRDAVDRTLVLDLARDVAHGVARPAAPLTAFLVGLAAGRDGADATAVRTAANRVRGLVIASPADASESSGSLGESSR